ncbi:MAG: thioredoxin domain-containing protein, partial [Longimicrobiales bacterium]|nr:thioredoxin domain-containing protein [Longimicrobiales bacterium]
MPNRLAGESSPYLLQHAHNPVDWYPWGPEALERARREDKPIFLSIGYSACHWCHVMERECFEDPEIARMMNERFINLKVDREERPDLDSIYMQAVQALSGQGGWPMSVFLTPQGEPFYGGAYFPPEDRGG